MSHLRWLAVWGMTGFSKPEKKDLNKWTKGIADVLGDPKGQHYFGKFLKERDFVTHVKILELWVRCDNLINQAAPVNQNEAQEILDEAQRLQMAPHVAFESQNEDEFSKLVKVQAIARDNLDDVYKLFAESLLTSSSQNKWGCLIL